ncbi:AMP-binding protein [Aurantimonas coralicida]|uniref:AMP-binding protein n=1 Tax=Aurantimonas coralicida TaxID=182270 RepID=UPI0004077276|nr:AMP-binding protein [Aurantimonas coralicida]
MTAPLAVSGSELPWPDDTPEVKQAAGLDTLPKLLAHNALLHPKAIAQREKEFGIWVPYDWESVETHVARMAVGFAGLGLGPGDIVALIGDNRPEWVWGEVAAHACRAMSLGIYRDALEEEIRYLFDYAQPKIVVAEDEEQVDKLLALGDAIPSVVAIVYTDPRGMRKYDDPRLIPIETLEAAGKDALDLSPNLWRDMVGATRGEDVAILCTTSGTTAHPKLAMWTGTAFIGHAASYLRADPRGPDDEYVAVLPLSWVMEQMYSVAWNFLARMKVNFPEEEQTTMADLREIGPTFVLFSPRVWETVAADIRARIMDSKRWKRAIYDWGVAKGMAAVEHGGHSGAADLLLFRHLRDRLGFTNLKSAATGGAAMGPDTFRFFQAMGVPLKQLYGQTEAMGAHTIHKDGEVDNETVGYPMPGCALKIRDPDPEGLGEVLVKHPNMMSGYYRNEAESEASLDAEGWFQTGDAGYLTDKRHLVVIDRIKDLATTAKGVRFSPQFIENKLKFSTYVAEAVILGNRRDYLTAMICIRFPIISKWAEERRISFTTYSDLAARREVYDLLRAEVERVNATLPAQQRIARFLLLYKELDADDGELTRTKKVRRSVIAEKYEDIIARLYSGADHVDVDTVIHFQDGSKQRIVTTLPIETLVPDAGHRQEAAE